MRKMSVLLFALVLAGNVGCATVLASKESKIPVSSSPAGAKVFIDGVERGTTPVTLNLDPRRSYTLVLKVDGEPDQVHELRNSVGAGWVVLDILFGLVPVIVDAGTGQWSYLEDRPVTVNFPNAAAAKTAAALQRLDQNESVAMKARATLPECNRSKSGEWQSANAAKKKAMLDECNRKVAELVAAQQTE